MNQDPRNAAAQEQAIRERLQQWRRAEPVLRRQREVDIRNADTQSAVAWFDGISRALGPDTNRFDQGLVEQQRWFSKARGI